MKFYITMPSHPDKYFEVSATSAGEALMAGLQATVWSEEDWLRTEGVLADAGYRKSFPIQRIDVSGQPY